MKRLTKKQVQYVIAEFKAGMCMDYLANTLRVPTWQIEQVVRDYMRAHF